MKRTATLPISFILLMAMIAASAGADSNLPAVKGVPTLEPTAIILSHSEEIAVENAAAEKAAMLAAGTLTDYSIESDLPPLPPGLDSIMGEIGKYSASLFAKDGAACIYTGLTSGVTDSVLLTPSYYIANQSAAYWTAMAIRSDPGTDWDLFMNKALGASPGCVDTLLAVSNASSGVDVVVADFNHMSPTARYLEGVQFSGAAGAQIEWDNGIDILTVNGGSVFRTTGPDDIIECWDVYLNSGVEYGFDIRKTPGTADIRFLLFQNPAAAPYHAGRGSALVDTVITYPLVYTPPSDGWYAVVVVNENGGADNYTLEAGICGSTTALVPATGQAIPPAYNHYTIDQQDSYWTAVAVRPDSASWSHIIDRFSFGTGASWPQCFSGGLGTGSLGYHNMGRIVEVTVADFNGGAEPLGTHYLTTSPMMPDSSGGVIEWDSGADYYHPDGAMITRSTDPADVIEIWDTGLLKGVPYNLSLSSSEPVQMMSILWSPPAVVSNGNVLAWKDEVSSCKTFTVDSTAYHGLAMINLNGGTGSYEFSISEQFFDDADATFADQTSNGRGMAWSDFDNDGDLDLYVTNYGDPNKLLINDGAGVFTDGATPLLAGSGLSLSTAWGDCDNDGDADLLYTNNGSTLHLFRNENGASFSDISAGPLLGSYTGTSATWIDYDNDGFLDISLSNSNSGKLFRGVGNGSFTDETPPIIASTNARKAAWSDYDDDGDMDIYAVGASANHLLRNDGGGVFADVTTTPLDNDGYGYDAAWSDFDLDGDMDLFVANQDTTDLLFRNDGSGIFANVSLFLPTDTLISRGAVWGDYDLNGYPDLFISGFGSSNRLMAGSDSSFSERPASVIILSDYSPAAAWADYDGDGDLDLSVINIPVLGSGNNQQINNALCSSNSWLNVDLEGVVSNRDGIGARITLYSYGKAYLRELTGHGAGFSSSPLLAHFGIPNDYAIDSVVVKWPRGARQTVAAPASKQTLLITEDTSYYVGVDGADDAAPPARLVLHGNVPNPFNPTTTIRFELPLSGKVRLDVYDVAGRQVRTLIEWQALAAGSHDVVWNGRDESGTDAASGIYFYKLRAAGESRTKKMILIR